MIWKIARLVGRPFSAVENRFIHRKQVNGAGMRQRSERFHGCTLYHFELSPFSFLVRKALTDLQIDIPWKDVLEDDRAHRELLAGGRRDQVPCLKIEKPGQPTVWMYESKDIISYLKNVK